MKFEVVMSLPLRFLRFLRGRLPLRLIARLPMARFPDDREVEALLRAFRTEPFSYRPEGCSLKSSIPGFWVDENEVQLGTGALVYESALKALVQWKMFPSAWTRIVPNRGTVDVGDVVLVVVRVFGLWWMSSCRVVYIVDEGSDVGEGSGPGKRFGFAYGTLPVHFERGEELFMIEHRADDSVWYTIRAVSNPNYWYVRVFAPLARYYQRRFAQESKAAMKQAVS